MPKYTKEEREQRRARKAEKKKEEEEAYRRKYGITLQVGDSMVLEDRTEDPPIVDAYVPIYYIGLYGDKQVFSVVLQIGDTDFVSIPHNKEENIFFDTDSGRAAYEV
jgi:hypothetical protein